MEGPGGNTAYNGATMNPLIVLAAKQNLAFSTAWYFPWCLLTFLVSLALSLLLTPVMMEAARKHDIVDRPDGELKNHAEPVPYLGGLAVYIAFVVTLGLLLSTFKNDIVLGLLSAGSMILVLGLVDDFGALSPAVKFVGQFLAAFILYKSGIRIEIAVLPAWMNAALSIFWIVGMCNAFNIIDVMDGLAGGVAVISCFFLFLVSVLKGNHPVLPIMTLALAGAVLGFLRYNFRPARIYLGDTGSMFIGLMLGSITMMVSYGFANPCSLLAPLLILGVPLFDTLFVMYHRARKGIPVFQGSRDHFALRLKKRTGSVLKTVILTYAAALIFGAGGLVLVFLEDAAASAVLAAAYLAAALVAGLLLSRVRVDEE